MDVCGTILVNANYEEFIVKCFYCATEIEISKWQDFVLHIKTSHATCDFYTENIELPETDFKEPKTEFIEFFMEDEAMPICTDLQSTESTAASSPIFDSELKYKSSPETHTTDDGDIDDDDPSLFVHDDQEDINCSGTLEPTNKFNPTFYRRNPRTTTFIELYKAQPCLWNTLNVNYKNKEAKAAAYKSMIVDMLTKASVKLTERMLLATIAKLHEQFKKIDNYKSKRKLHAIVLEHYESCKFLRQTSQSNDDEYDDGVDLATELKIKLNFTTPNDLTTNFIDHYANFPHLYDPDDENFSNVKVRKESYESMAVEFEIPNNNDDICDYDIYIAIQHLRLWYHKITKNHDTVAKVKQLSSGEQFYLQKCNFLPSKQLKQRLTCHLCQKQYYSDHALQTHQYKVHNFGDLPFKCMLCDRYFDKRGELVVHTQRAHIGKVHKCSYCEKTFAVFGDLRLHVRTHTGNRPYVCELCGKAFRIKTQLGYHVTAIHTKVRAFKCTMCPKDFLKNRDLKDHIKGHLNIRDKVCETCGKGFTNCHSLIRHRQIHSEVKKYVCKLCDARFSQFVGLNSHMKRKHNILRRTPKETATTSI